MCIGWPMQVIEPQGFTALCEGRGRRETVNMLLVGPQPAGTWLMVFLGSAREVLDETAAAAACAALDELEALLSDEAAP